MDLIGLYGEKRVLSREIMGKLVRKRLKEKHPDVVTRVDELESGMLIGELDQADQVKLSQAGAWVNQRYAVQDPKMHVFSSPAFEAEVVAYAKAVDEVVAKYVAEEEQAGSDQSRTRPVSP